VGQAAHDRGIGGRGVGEVDSDLGPMRCNLEAQEKFLRMSALRQAEKSSLRANACCCLPMTDRSSHDHGTRGKPGPAAPLARMGGRLPGTLGNGHATRMSPDRGNCRGSGLNDVHRGVGGTVVTVSSPYA
jgi:hypothetical protein